MLGSILFALALVIPLAMPAAAQNSPRQAVEAFAARYDKIFLEKDATSLAAMYTLDGILVTPHGPVTGREALQKQLTGVLRTTIDHATKVDQAGGNDSLMWATGSWSTIIESPDGPLKSSGFWGGSFEHDGNGLKCHVLTYNISPVPAPDKSP